MSAERMETPEEVAQTLARYEALAIETGEWEGTEPAQFSADGETWRDFWLDADPPALARGVVKRRGVEPVVVTMAWREAVPEQREVAPGEIDWHAKWGQNPMAVFGAAVLRRAYQRAFRDVIGDHREQRQVSNNHPTSGEAWEAPRDFIAEVLLALTPSAVDDLWAAAKGHRTPILERACRERKRALSEGPQVARPAPAIVPRPPSPSVPHLEPVKPVTRRSESRAQRDSGKRGGGRRG